MCVWVCACWEKLRTTKKEDRRKWILNERKTEHWTDGIETNERPTESLDGTIINERHNNSGQILLFHDFVTVPLAAFTSFLGGRGVPVGSESEKQPQNTPTYNSPKPAKPGSRARRPSWWYRPPGRSCGRRSGGGVFGFGVQPNLPAYQYKVVRGLFYCTFLKHKSLQKIVKRSFGYPLYKVRWCRLISRRLSGQDPNTNNAISRETNFLHCGKTLNMHTKTNNQPTVLGEDYGAKYSSRKNTQKQTSRTRTTAGHPPWAPRPRDTSDSTPCTCHAFFQVVLMKYTHRLMI